MPRSEEAENTRLGLVEEEASSAPLEIGGLGRADVDAKGGGEGSRMMATALAVMAGLYRPLELKKKNTDSRMTT